MALTTDRTASTMLPMQAGGGVKQPSSGSRRRLYVLVAAAVILLGLFIAGIGWAIWWLNDNISAPGPGATGSGPCGSADSVNIQLVFADGHTVQACTRDRPDCPNQTISGTANGQAVPNVSQFTINNQLRSSSRRYILFVRFDAALPAETGEQTLALDPRVGFPPDQSGPAPNNGQPSAAVIQISPRDPDQDGYTTVSGTITVSSSHGVARGRIDGNFSTFGAAPPTPVSPARIVGTFACNH